MCGRATLTVPVEEIAALFEAPPIPIGPPRYNLAPTQPLVTVRRGAAGARELACPRWGLVPFWANASDAKKLGARCVQARAESAPTSPAFREPFKQRRCLVVVSGFYEWSGTGAARVPHLVRRKDGGLLAIAGLWDRWRTDGTIPANDRDGTRVESAAVLTTPATGALAAVHDRMPLVLLPEDWEAWLGGSADDARALLGRGVAATLEPVAVSTWVNDVKHDDPGCLAPRDGAGLGLVPKRPAATER